MRRTWNFFLVIILMGMTVGGCGFLSEADLFPDSGVGESVLYDVPPETADRLRLPPGAVPPRTHIGITDYPEEGFFEIAIGPMELTADTHHMDLPPALSALPFDVWIHGFAWSIRDAEGNELPRDILHHVNLIEPARREVFSPIARRLFAAGRETGSVRLPSFVGMPISAGSPIVLVAMLTNPTGEHYPGVILRLRFPYSREGSGLIAPLEVLPFYLDVAGATGPKDFPVPPGESVRTWDTKPVTDGKIVAIGGHLHDYGESLLLRDETERRTLWRVEPIEDEEGLLVSVPHDLFLLPWSKRIRTDHTYRAEAMYRNPTGRPAPDMGMGAIGGIFIPSGSPGWDEPDFDDPVYREDIAYILRDRSSMGTSHGHGD